jgi:hypothetical protein
MKSFRWEDELSRSPLIEKKIVMLKCNFNIIFACEDDMCCHPFIIEAGR